MRTAPESAAMTARLSALHNRATRYEVVAEVGGRSCLLAYYLRSSRSTLLNLVREHGERLMQLAGLSDSDPVTYTRAGGWCFGGGKLRVRRTGRTERECILSGELPGLEAAPLALTVLCPADLKVVPGTNVADLSGT